MNAIKKKRRLKRSLKRREKEVLKSGWMRLCIKLGWFE